MPENYEKFSEVELVQRYQNGDHEAVGVLCEGYRARLQQFFRNRARGAQKEDIEDLVQETFARAIESLKNLQDPESFRAWIYTIARRLLRDWIKERKRRREYTSPEGIPDDESEQAYLIEFLFGRVQNQPEHETLDREFRDIRLRFEATLPPRALKIFRLRNNTDLTFEKIGEKMGIKAGAAKVGYYRTTKKFEEWLGNHYAEYLPLVSRKKKGGE